MIVPTLSPLDPNMSVVGLSLKGGGAFPPTEVYFIRLQDGQDIAAGTQIRVSNYWMNTDLDQRQFYLVNTEPGRYLAVACSKEGRGHWTDATEVTFFRKHAIGMTEIVVGAGEIGFMGEYDLSYPFFALLYQNDPDEAQLHYQKLMVFDPPTGFWSTLSTFYLLTERYWSATLGRTYPDQKDGGRLLITATEDLRMGVWTSLILNELNDLRASPLMK